jgi:hypothetical protein
MFNIIEKFTHSFFPNPEAVESMKETIASNDPLICYLKGNSKILWYEDIFEIAPAIYFGAILLGSIFYMYANGAFLHATIKI